MSYDKMASVIQSSISKRAWAITKEQAFGNFYKEHGRFKEAKASKAELKALHKGQVQDKRVLSVLRELFRMEEHFDKGGSVIEYFEGAM